MINRIFFSICILSFIFLPGHKCREKGQTEDKSFYKTSIESYSKVKVDEEKIKILHPHDSMLFASLERTACFGTCPMYKFWVYRDGVVVYRVIRFVENKEPGYYKSVTTLAKMRALIEKAYETGFFAMNDIYPDVSVVVYDLPSTITYINEGGKIKEVRNGNYDSPAQLLVFEKYFDDLFTGAVWEWIVPEAVE